MPNVIGVRFKPVTKIYHFLPPEAEDIQLGDPVIVETSRGVELGWVATDEQYVTGSEIKGNLKNIVRRATPLDLMQLKDFRDKEADALVKCKHKVAELDLPMKMVAAEYAYDGSRLTFMFCAEQRVDFRELVRALARIFRTRVEMRQIGARDEAKIIDGYGRCGRRLCCSSWLTEFHPVSIKMAKNQNLPLAPTEISGLCGRLLCCLAYEDDTYVELRKDMPQIGSQVETADGPGQVRGLNILQHQVLVELESGIREEYDVESITVIAQKPAAKNQNKKSQPGRRRKRRNKTGPNSSQ